ncbi:MAG: helix-turn-helix domain-containing protein [Blautia sp.]|nr:helix-turn-helix domain-containing protein [Blautia sp.]
MLQINGLDEGLEIFKALGSEVRMRIVQLLSQNGDMNLNDLAQTLEVTNGAITAHIKKLEECGIIQVKTAHTGHGIQKICSLAVDEILLNLYPAQEVRNFMAYETSIRVGHYSQYSAKPGCGMAGPENLIGPVDDARCFSYPEHLDAELVWLHDGYMEYRIPNLLPEGNRIMQMTISFEVSDADYGMEEDPNADIAFYLNGSLLGEWRSLPSVKHSRGIYTPAWWNGPLRQHGYLKMLVVNERGAFLDGVKITETIPDLNQEEMTLRFESRPKDGHTGGLALYGSGFGNYKQDIHVRIHYSPAAQMSP